MKNFILVILFGLLFSTSVMAQESTLTKEQVLKMSLEELSELPLEDLMYAVELLEVQSVDELFALVMNKSVASASKKTEDSFKSPLSTAVITRAEMQTFGCTTIEEALRMLPGVIVREKTNGNYDIHLRGLDNIPDGNMFLYTENVNTLLMINSRPVYCYGQGSTMWETLPVGIEDINRIEVVRGPNSALYGSNAVTGVINIITETPNPESKSINGTMTCGTLNTYTGDLAFRKCFNEKWAASMSVNFQRRNRSTDKFFIMGGQGVVNIADTAMDFTNEGHFVSILDVTSNLRNLYDGQLYAISEDCSNVADEFPSPEMARENIGVNGTLVFTPKEDINFNLMAGYQNSLAATTPVGDDYYSLGRRESKQYYIDLNANVKGLNLQFNWNAGPQDFLPGSPGMKTFNKVFTATAEYDWMPTERLTIRPGFNYRYISYDDYDYDHYYGLNKYGETTKLVSFLQGEAQLKSLAGGLRLDFSPTDYFRVIGAYRAEKLNLPDRLYHSWQVAATLSPNDKHNVRLIYSRGNRSAIITNTSCGYEHRRVNLCVPDYIRFKGNEEHDVVYADNFELGYRWRPSSNLILDLEGFYNISQDYGALMATSSEIFIEDQRLYGMFQNALSYLGQMQAGLLSPEIGQAMIMNEIATTPSSATYVQYNNVPYKVKQLGVSLALDWILSDKLIVKAHLNAQQTKIDNYFLYSQKADVVQTLTSTSLNYAALMNDVSSKAFNPETLPWALSLFNVENSSPELVNEYHSLLSPDGKQTEASQAFLEKYNNMLGYGNYVTLLYDVTVAPNEEGGRTFTIGTSRNTTIKDIKNGHKHKATPSIYGLLGFVYKPLPNLSIGANGYFFSKQTYTTLYGTEDIDAKCIVNFKVGYKPAEEFEFFLGAHNLFNSDSQEFVYMDPASAVYSVGVSFGF